MKSVETKLQQRIPKKLTQINNWMNQIVTKQLTLLSLETKDKVGNLGVLIDSELTFINHIKSITKTIWQLKNISRLKDAKLLHQYQYGTVNFSWQKRKDNTIIPNCECAPTLCQTGAELPSRITGKMCAFSRMARPGHHGRRLPRPPVSNCF